MMTRLHVIGGKNHGKTTLIVELVQEFSRRGVTVGTIKHTHHHHELDVPGKDSYRHRLAGASAVGILSPSMTAVFRPVDEDVSSGNDRYSHFAPLFQRCRLVLVEGDSQTTAPKIEVWRSELGTPPLATRDRSILALVTDDTSPASALVLPRNNVPGLADWIDTRMLARPTGE
jgi:molybdopterin-guanine dinucleotide biosynthesis protein B